jgi:hypothetical protein
MSNRWFDLEQELLKTKKEQTRSLTSAQDYDVSQMGHSPLLALAQELEQVRERSHQNRPDAMTLQLGKDELPQPTRQRSASAPPVLISPNSSLFFKGVGVRNGFERVYPPNPVSTCRTPPTALNHHSTAFLRTNQIQLEPFVLRFANDPLTIYLELQERARKAPQGNFKYPELIEVFLNIKRHINTIKQRVHCGEEDAPNQEDFRCQVHKNVSPQLQLEIQQTAFGNLSVLDQVLADIAKLNANSYPYKDSLRLITKFMKLVDYITYRAKTEAEVRALTPQGQAVSANDSEQQILVRTSRRTKFKNQFGCGFPVYASNVTLKDIYSYAPNHWPHGGWTDTRMELILAEPDIILLPSYNPLDTAFFTKIRQVPMFLIGLIDIEYLKADRDYQSPLQFMDHDCFHVYGPLGQKPQLFHTMKYRIEEIQRLEQADGKTPSSPVALYRIWDQNAKILRRLIDKESDQDLVSAINIILFTVLHEPLTSPPGAAALKGTTHLPALVDKHAIASRLQDGPNGLLLALNLRLAKGEFGIVSQKVLNALAPAAQWVLNQLPFLEDDPGKGKGLYTKVRKQEGNPSDTWGEKL